MDANDIESESDVSAPFQETGEVQDVQEVQLVQEVQHIQEVQEIYVEEGNDEDVHVCRKCNMVFYDIQKYLEHKVKHDNFKMKMCKSNVDKRMIMPMLVQRQKRPRKEKIVVNEEQRPNEEKENDQQIKTGKGGRRKLSELHNQDLVIREKPVYTCTKCDRKFNREAPLKRHMEYDHKDESDSEDGDDDDDDDDDGGVDDVDDDDDQEYKPNQDVVKETILEDEEAEQEMQDEAPAEDPPCTDFDSLDQVIMAAALVEKAEAQSGGVQLGQLLQSLGEENEVVMIASTEETGTTVTPQTTTTRTRSGGKRATVSDDDKTGRKFICGTCKNRFKELAVLKAHMLTHTNKRGFTCLFEGCTYAFKTKGSLKRHMRRHTGERPYPCELCGRTFSESGALTRHLKSRTPCTTKTDDDLPRYRKTWATDPNIPAAVGALASPQKDPTTGTTTIGSLLGNVTVSNVHSLKTTDADGHEHLSPLQTTSEVLDGIQDNQDKHLFDGTLSEGAEVVITHDDDGDDDMEEDVDTITADESIQDFVHTETVSQSDTIVCKVCQEEYLSLEALKTHLRTHLAEDTCKCQLCHFITESKEEFENHMFLHHHVQIRSSDPLSELASSREERTETRASDIIEKAQVALKQLMDLPPESGEIETNSEITGTQISIYKCPVCNKQFRRPNYLKFHMRNHTGLRPHRCPKCSRSFITRDTLKKHMSTHNDDRSFKCGECGKLFKRLSHVRDHIKIHSASRPFMCTICDKSFKTNNAMKVHLRTHTDILPYECSFCHRRFREKGSVIRHTRMHTGEKPYECRFCGRRFAEHGTLNRHLKAKVSCKRQVVMMKDFTDDEETDYSVLAEFSSVVADTQQYMVPETEEELEVKTDDGAEKKQNQDSDQPTEIVVVQSSDSDGQLQNVEIENVEVLTNADGSPTEGVQVTDDYIVVTDASNNIMSVLDSKTGETVAIVPMSDSESGENQVQTITMSQEGEVSTVTMVPEKTEVGETVTIAQLVQDEKGLQQVMETTSEGMKVEVMEAVQTDVGQFLIKQI